MCMWSGTTLFWCGDENWMQDTVKKCPNVKQSHVLHRTASIAGKSNKKISQIYIQSKFETTQDWNFENENLTVRLWKVFEFSKICGFFFQTLTKIELSGFLARFYDSTMKGRRKKWDCLTFWHHLLVSHM